MKKIVIGLPNATGDTRNEWSAMLSGICVQLALKGYHVDTICVDGSMIDNARNTIIQVAKDSKADYVFFLDDDTYVDLDCVTKLIELDKDIASPPVASRKGEDFLNILHEDLTKYYKLEKTQKVSSIGMACTLIKMKVIEDMLDKYMKPFEFQNATLGEKRVEIGEDIGFCLRAAQMGYETWAVKGIKTWHEGSPKKYCYEG